MLKTQFRAINPTLEVNIITPDESEARQGFTLWGINNDYPQYLDTLYREVATLHSIIEGTVDYVVGDGVNIDDVVFDVQVNETGYTIEDLVRDLSRDYLKYGGFSVNAIRNVAGNVGALHYIPFERIRLSENKDKVFYSKDWSKSVGRVKFLTYPVFSPDGDEPSSIYIYSNSSSTTYPTPKWAASVKAAEIERQVNDYHLNSISNGFSASYLMSFNNGIPSDSEADEIEENVLEKFSGSGNGGRIVINFANDKEHSAELSKLETDDAGEKYKSLIERTHNELFTAFRATPNLFGLPTATGFSTEEYMEAFKLYNRTVVLPVQKIIVKSINKLIGKTITITPFSLDYDKEKDIKSK